MKYAGVAPSRRNAATLPLYIALVCLFLSALSAQAATVEPGSEPSGIAASPAEQSPGLVDRLKTLGQRLGVFSDGQQFLDPDRAFVFSADVDNGNLLTARWDIADGYYMYRDKFAFNLLDADGARIGQYVAPQGKFKEDETFGRSEVYYHDVAIKLPLERSSAAPATVTLEVKYQGCADAGFCYPPITKTTQLALPAASAAATTDDGFVSEQDRFALSLAGDNLALTVLTFFGVGLLLAFTPCVFPMVPILSSIIVGRGEQLNTRHAFLLSLAYVLPMALTYTAAGILAGLFGANLQAAFQNPWIIGSFVAVFVLLALSMFGFYELQVPSAVQSRLASISKNQRGGTFAGAAVMGFLSALIVGPCVAAPLAGALIYISQTGDAALGGLALFALSMGMGTPLLALGTSAGRWLPKAGAWMKPIKAVFGVLLLGVAIWMLDRIVPASVTMVLTALLLIIAAIYMGALDRLERGTNGWRRLWKGGGLAMLVYGVVLVIGAAGGGTDVLHPLRDVGFAAKSKTGSAEVAHEGLTFRQVKGLDGLNRELELAAAAGKPVMLDFYADWCVSCKEMERYTFSDRQVQAALADVVLLQTDVTANDEQDQALLRHFGLFGPPSILFFDPQGSEQTRYRLVGFLDAEDFHEHLARVLSL